MQNKTHSRSSPSIPSPHHNHLSSSSITTKTTRPQHQNQSRDPRGSQKEYAKSLPPSHSQQQAHATSSSSSSTSAGNSNTKSSIKFRTSFSNTIYDVLSRRTNYTETSSLTNWHIHWSEREWVFEIFDTTTLKDCQRINHFRNAKEICRKDLLVKNLKKRRRQLEKEGNDDEAEAYDFFPVTFNLPREYALFVEEFKKIGGLWIMKPIGAAQGKGIFLFSKLSEISEWRTVYRQGGGSRAGGTMGPPQLGVGGSQMSQLFNNNNSDSNHNHSNNEKEAPEAYVVQRYISNPYLVGGKKFDLRLYCLVTSFAPLTAWIYRGGFCRFASTRYSSEYSTIADSMMHLTNVAIQKTGTNYDKRTGGKWDLTNLKLHMISQFGIDTTDAVFWEMQMVIIRTLLSAKDSMINDKHCFELYGYDIMIDDALKPWLIEVNASPSLSANTEADYIMKCEMLDDVLAIVDVEGARNNLDGVVGRDGRLREEHVGGFDLVYEGGFVEMEEIDKGWSAYLGSSIDRGPNSTNGDGVRVSNSNNSNNNSNSSRSKGEKEKRVGRVREEEAAGTGVKSEKGGGGGRGEEERKKALDAYSKFLNEGVEKMKM